MNAKSVPAGKKEKVSANFMVLTVSELDLLVFEALVKQGAAKKDPKQKSGYIITNKIKAQSKNILPKVLNSFGKKGWRLTAVNKMECYIFEKVGNGGSLEYLVATPPDLDKIGMKILQDDGHLKLSGFEGDVPKVEVLSPKDAKIQNVLPRILNKYAEDKWQLCTINGPQIYFFTRPIV